MHQYSMRYTAIISFCSIGEKDEHVEVLELPPAGSRHPSSNCTLLSHRSQRPPELPLFGHLPASRRTAIKLQQTRENPTSAHSFIAN